jgi:hypothetical protein
MVAVRVIGTRRVETVLEGGFVDAPNHPYVRWLGQDPTIG